MRVGDIVLFQLIKKEIQLDVFCICACLCPGVRQQPPIHSFESTSVTQCHHMPLLLWDAATINFAWVDFLFVMDPGWTSQGAASLPPHLRCGQLSPFLLSFPNLSNFSFHLLTCLVSLFTKGVNWGKWLRNQCHIKPNYRYAISLLWNEIFHITI